MDDIMNRMARLGEMVHLFLNDRNVGTITIRGRNASWTYGDFTPAEDFSHFANVFGCWSLLLHADDQTEKLSEAASKELRRLEYAIDAIRAKIYFPTRNEYRPIVQVNIDQGMVEWKEF
jgi:hypothetical protein